VQNQLNLAVNKPSRSRARTFTAGKNKYVHKNAAAGIPLKFIPRTFLCSGVQLIFFALL